MRTELALDAILALSAGREVDALVAEWVMEWHRRKRNGVEVWAETTDTFDPPATYPVECWEPSTSIANAWDILDKHKRWSIERNKHGVYYCYLAKELEYAVGGLADTAPLAICRAALKAVMGD